MGILLTEIIPTLLSRTQYKPRLQLVICMSVICCHQKQTFYVTLQRKWLLIPLKTYILIISLLFWCEMREAGCNLRDLKWTCCESDEITFNCVFKCPQSLDYVSVLIYGRVPEVASTVIGSALVVPQNAPIRLWSECTTPLPRKWGRPSNT